MLGTGWYVFVIISGLLFPFIGGWSIGLLVAACVEALTVGLIQPWTTVFAFIAIYVIAFFVGNMLFRR